MRYQWQHESESYHVDTRVLRVQSLQLAARGPQCRYYRPLSPECLCNHVSRSHDNTPGRQVVIIAPPASRWQVMPSSETGGSHGCMRVRIVQFVPVAQAVTQCLGSSAAHGQTLNACSPRDLDMR